MIEIPTRLRTVEWLAAAAVASLGATILFDAHAGINGGIWVAAAVAVTLACRRPQDFRLARPSLILGAAAFLAASASALTTDVQVHAGIFWLTAFLLAAFLNTITADDSKEVKVPALLASPFVSAARVGTSSVREIGLAVRAATDSPFRAVLRRTLLVTPVVLLLIALFGGADPVVHAAIHDVETWLPQFTFAARTVFFILLLLLMLGACSRLPAPSFGFTSPRLQLPKVLTETDAMVLVGSTLATLTAFLALQTLYLFVRLPGAVGNGVTFSEYARRGFGELCAVVTIVAAVILFTERLREPHVQTSAGTLRKMEIALIVAAALILLSAQRRVVLYEHAYGYTTARVHATAYIVFMAGFLFLLAIELRGVEITSAFGRRSSALALIITLALLYWNDQAWIMNRNIDRVHVSGKFDVKYAARLSLDAFPALVRRRGELPPAAWDALRARAACKPLPGHYAWYEWNAARSAVVSAWQATSQLEPSKCSLRLKNYPPDPAATGLRTGVRTP